MCCESLLWSSDRSGIMTYDALISRYGTNAEAYGLSKQATCRPIVGSGTYFSDKLLPNGRGQGHATSLHFNNNNNNNNNTHICIPS